MLNKTGFFAVPKGDDICIVYNATKSLFNTALWCPSFYLTDINSVLQNADSSTWFGDIYIEWMFLNYMLEEELRPYASVDVSGIFIIYSSSRKPFIEQWERTLVELRSSPFTCTQTFGWSEDVLCEDHFDSANALGCDKVVLNLPGYRGYNLTNPWVYHINIVTGQMNSFFTIYIDDIITGYHSQKSCRDTSRQVEAGVNYLGQKDASRKRRVTAKRPGDWVVAV